MTRVGFAPRPPARRWAVGGVLAAAGAVVAAATAAPASHPQEERFPHAAHEGLFPVCSGCHEGLSTGDAATVYPEPESCARCHDGNEVDVVAWRGPARLPDNVRFDHREHGDELRSAGDAELGCASCHGVSGGGRMSVADVVGVAGCLSCHAHRATEHLSDARCETCHVPLADSEFEVARIAALPRPDDHDATEFLAATHADGAGDVARCATCHTADRCLSCHVDGVRPEIAALPPAPVGMALPQWEATYPVPATHLDDLWFYEHGSQASLDSCGTCHTSDDCMACHLEPASAVVAELPRASRSRAPGVGLVERAPESHASFFFLAAHAALTAGGGSCATCHEESFCTDCHDGPADGGYHPRGFVARHSADAAGRSSECSACHSTQAFCRACHLETGLAPVGRGGFDYHAGGPLWLIRHGQAARQNLESCASCHAQADCTACHGTLGAFKVSPHTPDFDARRAFERSPRACAACHLRNPIGGSGP